jgi:crossover junction endonuclease MUS81
LTKAEVIAVGQQYCDSSFTAPSDPTKHFTAWNSIKTLTEKDIVYERGRPLRRYALTEEGWEVARRIKKAAGGDQGVLDGFVAGAARASEQSGGRPTAGVQADKDALQPRRTRAIDKSGFAELLSSSPTSVDGEEQAQATNTEGSTVQEPAAPAAEAEDGQLPEFTPHVIPAGSFTVHLVLDTREVRAKQDRDYIQNELTNKGVQPIMRSLELGDALWVAKLHDATSLQVHGEEGDEIMLDCIVERKRLDDLVGSIKDGRFHEQKFRLRKSGAKNVVYIIEEVGMNAEYYAKYQEAVESAVASTQVVNGYFVKQTQKLDDTIRYLTRMTVLLKSLYEVRQSLCYYLMSNDADVLQGKELNVIPTNVLTPKTHLPLLRHLSETKPSCTFHITYAAFASLSSKSDALTLRDVFLRMLMCTRGVTGDKALEIQRIWKTPASFVEAYKACGEGEGGDKARSEMLHKNMGHLVGRKKMGKAVSGKVAEVWAE